MSFLQILLLVIAGILILSIILVFREKIMEILVTFCNIIKLILCVAGIIVLLPFECICSIFRIFFNDEEKVQSTITKTYDKIFFSTKNRKQTLSCIKTIQNLEKRKMVIEETNKEKQVKEFLDKVKWVL